MTKILIRTTMNCQALFRKCLCHCSSKKEHGRLGASRCNANTSSLPWAVVSVEKVCDSAPFRVTRRQPQLGSRTRVCEGWRGLAGDWVFSRSSRCWGAVEVVRFLTGWYVKLWESRVGRRYGGTRNLIVWHAKAFQVQLRQVRTLRHRRHSLRTA